MVFGIIAVVAAVISTVICGLAGGFGSLAWLWMLPVGWVGAFVCVLLLAFLMVLVMCACVDLEKEEKKDSRFYRSVLYMIADTRGLEKIPTEGRVRLVGNHLDNVDPVIIMHQVKKMQTLAFIAKREVASMFVVGKFMHKILCQRVNRENDREALKTILRCIEILKEDKASIAVFPEGGIKGGNVLHPFRHGVFKIAQRTQVPIVVCTLWGTQNVFHNGLRLKPTDVDFHVLGVVQPEEIKGKTAVEVGQLVHSMMAADLGPDRVLQVEENP